MKAIKGSKSMFLLRKTTFSDTPKNINQPKIYSKSTPKTTSKATSKWYPKRNTFIAIFYIQEGGSRGVPLVVPR